MVGATCAGPGGPQTQLLVRAGGHELRAALARARASVYGAERSEARGS
jgi:hypothetical protein